MKKYHRELLAIHNHPYNHIPSLEDIYEMFNNDALCGIIVRTEKYNYYLFPKINTLDTIKENFDEFSSWFEKRLGKFNDEFFSKYPNKSNDELNYMAFKEVFERMGWKYGREKI